MIGAFRIDVYSASNVKTNGTTNAISRVSYSVKASKVGALSFVVPTLEYINAGMGVRKWYYLYHKRLGFIGRFRHLNEDFDEDAETVSVTCEDALASLIDVSLDFNMSSVSSVISTELTRLLGRVGWTATLANASNEYNEVAIDYQGINVFQALDSLRQMQRGFFVLSGANSVKVGRWTDALRDSSAYTLITNAAMGSTGAAISSLTVVGTSQYIVNRIIPRGQGIGTTQVDLSKSTRTSPYTILSRANWDGGNTDGATPSAALTHTYYFEDATSIAENGVVERVAVFSDIRPITNSLADQRNAANALYDVASAYMQQYKNPTTEYQVRVIGTDALIRAGDVVMIDYRGVSETATGRKSRVFIDKKRFFVVEATHDFDDASGEPVTTLTLAENGTKLADTNDVFTNLLADLDKFKLRPAPSMTFRTKAGDTSAISPSLSYSYRLKLGIEVLEVNNCKLEFHLMKLRSYSNNATNASSTTTTSSGGGQTVTTTSAAGGATSTTTNSAGDASTTGYTHATSIGYQSGLGFTSAGILGNSYTLYASFAGNTGGIAYGTAGDQHGHYNAENNHRHEMAVHEHKYSLPAHSHGFSIANHSHSVSITVGAHTHDFAHTHPIEFGVFEDSVEPAGVIVKIDGTQVTPIKELATGQFAGNDVDGEGWYYVDLTAMLKNMTDWRGVHSVEISCAQGRGMVYATSDERLTIQPIAVSD